MNHFVFDEFKVAEVLFLQLLPRFPLFYALLTKKQTLFFAHFFEKILRHTFLFSKFLDPILTDSFFLVSAAKLHFSRPLQLGPSPRHSGLHDLMLKSQQIFGQMTGLISDSHRFLPMNLVLRAEMLRVYIRFFFENSEALLKLLQLLRRASQTRGEWSDEAGSLELERRVFDCLRQLRNVSLSLFTGSKLVSWFEFLDKFGFVDFFIDCFELLATKLAEQRHFKHELVLKFLSFPSFARRAEVSLTRSSS